MTGLMEVSPESDDRRRSPHSPLLHFFKIILPRIISEKKLKIPSKFVRKFRDELSHVANLIIPNGSSWKVGLRKVQNDIWFDDGWHDFVEYHSICSGYLLVFGYRGFSNFSVFIFDASACEIGYPCGDQGLISGDKLLIESPVEVEGEKPLDVFGSKTLSPNRSSLKSKLCDAKGSEGEPSKRLPPLEQNLRMKERSKIGSPAMSPKIDSNYETRSKKLKIEQLDELTNVGPSESKWTLKKCKMTCSNELDESGESNQPKIKSGENELKLKFEEGTEIITNVLFELNTFSPETKKAILAARKCNPEHPSFMVVLSSYNCSYTVLYVPKEFCRRYLSKASRKIKLEASDGREWTIRLRRTGTRMDFGQGLLAFFRDNNLKAGDVCLFELIKDNAVLKASIFYAAPDIEIITNEMFDSMAASRATKRAIRAARKYKPQHPSFMVVIHINILYVPKQFSRRYLERVHRNLKLDVSDGREWTVSLQRQGKSAGYGKGWGGFCRDNNLRSGDVCIFSLKKDRMVLTASMFRAAEHAVHRN